MRRVTLFIQVSVLMALTTFAPRAQQPSGYDLFQQALAKERAAGQVDEAIRIYLRIGKEFGGDRALAAKALVQIGRCYETLGRTEARAAYERVVREFGDQAVPVSEARRRLAVLAPPPRAGAGGLVSLRWP